MAAKVEKLVYWEDRLEGMTKINARTLKRVRQDHENGTKRPERKPKPESVKKYEDKVAPVTEAQESAVKAYTVDQMKAMKAKAEEEIFEVMAVLSEMTGMTVAIDGVESECSGVPVLRMELKI